LFVCKVPRNCATKSWPGSASEVAATIGAMRPTPTELVRGGSSAHREGEGYRPEHQAGRRAAGVRRSRMSSRRAWRRAETVCARAMGKNISRPKQVTDWVARLEKLEQTLAAESGSSLLVQPAWRRMCWPDFCATNSLVRKMSACLCQIQRLLAADQCWGGANAHREAEGRRVPTEFLPNSWLFEVGVDQYHRALRARALSLTTHRDPRRGLGRA
jgi:hypothetical protein